MWWFMYILNIWNIIGNTWIRWFNYTQRVEKCKILLQLLVLEERYPSSQTFSTAFPAQNLADNFLSFSLLKKGCQPE